MIKNLFQDIAKYLPSTIVPGIVGIAFLPIITRLFAPTDYGNYVLVMATITVLSTFVGWVDMSVIRFYPYYEKEGKITEFTRLSIKLTFLSILIISVIFLCILFLLRNHISKNLYPLMSIGLCFFVFNSFFILLLDFLRIKRRINWYSGFFVWNSLMVITFGLLFVILFHLGVDGLLWGAVLSVGLVLPFLWKIAVGKLRIKDKEISIKPTIEMAKYSFPLVVGNFAAWILSLSDRYMLQFFRGAREVGIYSISYKISDSSIMFFISLFALAFNPISIIVWEKEGREKSQDFLSQGTRYFLLLCIPAIFGISVLREPILRILTTPNYYEGARIIPFIVLGVFLLGLNQRFGAGLSFYKKTHFFMYSLIISGFINLGLNFLFIPKYGYIAAAATTLVSYGILLTLNIIVSRWFFTWQFPFKSLINSISASVIMGVVVHFISTRLTFSTLINSILSVCSGGLIYCILIFSFQEFQPKEKEAMKKILKKICLWNNSR